MADPLPLKPRILGETIWCHLSFYSSDLQDMTDLQSKYHASFIIDDATKCGEVPYIILYKT